MHYVDDIPAVDILYQPFLMNGEEKIRKAVVKGSPIRGKIDEAIKATGSTVLWWQAYGGATMLSNGGSDEQSLRHEGQESQGFGKTLGQFVEASGGAQTLISGSEQYLAYQMGTVDVGLTGDFRCKIAQALRSEGYDHCDKPCGYRVYCSGEL